MLDGFHQLLLSSVCIIMGAKMKRIDAVIPIERLNSVNEALRLIDMTGVTVFYSTGRGQAPSQQKSSGQEAYIPEFNSNCVIMAVVNDAEVEKIIVSILQGAGSGKKREGKIFVSDVSEAVDIGSKQRGEKAL